MLTSQNLGTYYCLFFYLLRDKAGGYGIQALGGMLVEYVHGDFLNVVGFPLNHFCKKLTELYYPPPKHTIQHIKHDSIPSVETFEIQSDGEFDSSDNTLCKGAKKQNSSRILHLSGKCVNGNSICNVPADSQNGVKEDTTQFPPKLVQLLDGFKASKVTVLMDLNKYFSANKIIF